MQGKAGAEIRSPRLVMRPLGLGDVDAVHAMMSDYDTVKTTGTWPWPADKDHTATRCIAIDPAQGAGGAILLGDVMVGTMGLKDQVLGYTIHRDHWGNGYATEMARALIDHCFDRFDWPLVIATAYAENPASARVLEKLGFTQIGAENAPNAARSTQLPAYRYHLPRRTA